MKLAPGNGDAATIVTTPVNYSNYANIPSDYTKVAYYPASTAGVSGSSFTTTYQVFASTSQTAGTYTGKVKYTLVHPHVNDNSNKPEATDPKIYMQDLNSTSLATLLPNIGDTATVYDNRDEEEYLIGKLADGKYWMLDNLNLAGGTALSADDTDVTSAYISSFTTSNNLTKSGSTIVLPASSTSGFNTVNYSYVYNSNNKTNNCANPGCYSYYSWDAATLGSGRNIIADNTDATQSICPKGWRLPRSRTTSANNWQTEGDFYVLAHQYGLDSTTSTSEIQDDDFYVQAGPGTIPNFLTAGYYYSNSHADGRLYGYYWSSTSGSTDVVSYALYFGNDIVASGSINTRLTGLSVRCLAQ